MHKPGTLYKRAIPITLIIVGIMGICSCNRGDNNLPLLRFEKVVFGTSTENLESTLKKDTSFNSPLLNIHPNDPRYMTMLTEFSNDPVLQDIYRITDSCFHDLKWLERELNRSLKRASSIHPDIHYTKLFTLVTGSFDYSNRVFCTKNHLAISLDQYALPCFEKYGYFATPLHLIQLCDSSFMVSDCMAAIAREYIKTPQNTNGDLSLLDYMIAEGKVLYFLDNTLPKTADHIKIRYTPEQWDWMTHNETNVWSYLLQYDLLYSTDYNRFHNFIDDAPKTNAFKDSAPRTSHYIGWQIVKSYAKRTGCTMKELFEESDSQAILNQSAYHPSRS